MNWVEHRFNTEAAIERGLDILWQRLTRVIKEAVDSYNRHYGKEHGGIISDESGRCLWLKRKNFVGNVEKHRLDDVVLKISVNPDVPSISSHCHPHSPVTLNVCVKSQNEELFLFHDGEVSLDEACQLLTVGFLFDRRFSKQPH